ncbi:beta-lactamase family protein [Altererythrobacter sp. RZ02]|uniref:Beta-lactamase family protein n=1 Tax=Pontixanthobacter rizhaonensis TaxID=2730337 RepID=A0A848QKD0_9SPHN|nr:serine hydrolase domain-containing protein [Pontixanthobacter rizhaonensis]NMW31269.1 beta-lactamase family protein [Pontixanthobacter rizhaonensis]
MTHPIHGHCDPRFALVKRAFETNFAEHGDVGASVAITLNGEFVVDLWGGHLDEERSQPWQEDTLVNVWSSTKTMAAMALLVLADRNEVDLDAPASRYWPEFSQNGKDAVKVRHFLSHSAGLAGMDETVEGDALYDWDWMVQSLAKQAPWWEPGTQSGYHALTQGHLIGEIVRRITGQSIGTFFRQEIAEPTGADFHIGAGPELDTRIGNLIPPTAPPMIADSDSIAARTFTNPKVDATLPRERGWRAAEIPAANGQGNARSIVRAQTAMANGGRAFGKTILSEAGTKRIFEQQTDGTDLVLGIPVKFGLGYGLNSEATPMSPNAKACFWGGYGGSSVIVDQDAGLCFSYVMNRMESGLLGDPRGFGLAGAMYASMQAIG